MEANVLVSVVIPVWNPGEDVKKCIASLREQTLTQIEMIFVDDRGTDRSMEYIRDAAAQDPRIRILTNPENRGPGYSRNAGIEAARGEYVGFVDPDDYLASDYLERLYTLASGGGLDIAKGRIQYEKEDGTVARHHEQNDVIRAGLKAHKPIYAIFSYEHHSAIYRREMLMTSGARYGLARRAQDTTFLLRACHSARTMALDDDAIYRFCERGNSAMHVFSLSSLEQRLFSFREQVDYLSSALGDDPYAPAYTTGLFLSNLRFFACYEHTPENESAIRAYAVGMQEQVRRLPYADKMAERCFSVRALLEDGVLLPTTPGFLPWEQPSSGEWLALLGQWVSYLAEHPERMEKARFNLSQISAKAEAAGVEEGREGDVKQSVEKELSRLPVTSSIWLRFVVAAKRAIWRLLAALRNLRGNR